MQLSQYEININTIIIIPFSIAKFIWPICKNIAIDGISGMTVRSEEVYLTV